MLTCSFIGNFVYDKDLPIRIKQAVDDIARRDDEIEFIFFQTGLFYSLCLGAVLAIKRRYPKKDITVTVVKWGETFGSDAEQAAFLRRTGDSIPACVIDKTISPPPTVGAGEISAASYGKIVQWVIGRSDCIVSYVYPQTRRSLHRQYKYAQECDVSICDVTDESTADFIRKTAAALPEPERQIVRGMDEGVSISKIAKGLGLAAGSVSRMNERVQTKLHSAAVDRLRQIYVQDGPQEPRTCGVFGMGAAENALETFGEIAAFLIRSLGVTRFLVEQSYCRSAYVNILAAHRRSHPELQLVAVTHYPEDANDALDGVRKIYSCTFDTIINIDPCTRSVRAKTLRTNKAIADDSEFCICNLSEHNPLADSMRRYFAKHRDIIVFDMSKR